MSGWLFLSIGIATALVDFAVGLAWSRRTVDDLPRNPDGTQGSAEAINRLGGILMIVAPLFLLVFAAIAFGMWPIDGVEPIAFD
jgi:hypothetical protein